MFCVTRNLSCQLWYVCLEEASRFSVGFVSAASGNVFLRVALRAPLLLRANLEMPRICRAACACLSLAVAWVFNSLFRSNLAPWEGWRRWPVRMSGCRWRSWKVGKLSCTYGPVLGDNFTAYLVGMCFLQLEFLFSPNLQHLGFPAATGHSWRRDRRLCRGSQSFATISKA